MKRKRLITFGFVLVFIFLFIVNVHSEDTIISTDIHSLQSGNQGKTILLVAAHGAGKDCNHASTTVNGKKYYENIESREMIDLIADYFDEHNIKYEIANEIVGDDYWSADQAKRNAARSCTNPNNNSCCGFRTSTIGSYANLLAAHVDSMGKSNYYSMVFELHFNAGGGSYSLVMGRDQTTRLNGERIAQEVVNSIGYGSIKYGTDLDFYGSKLGTLTTYYTNRGIPTYYLETVFMDNQVQFQAYLNNKEKLAKNIAEELIRISPNSVGDGGNQYENTGVIGGTLGGLTYDPYSEYYLSLTYDEEEHLTCTNIFMKNGEELNDLGWFMRDLYFLIKLGTVVMVIVLSTMDLYKYLVKDDAKKKVISSISKRIMIGLIIFFLPDLLDILFHLFGLYDLSNCAIG